MRWLSISKGEKEAFIAAMNFQPFDRTKCKSAQLTLWLGLSWYANDELAEMFPDVPSMPDLRQWRSKQEWSIRLIDRHEAALASAREAMKKSYTETK